jgi:hypothetical protein
MASLDVGPAYPTLASFSALDLRHNPMFNDNDNDGATAESPNILNGESGDVSLYNLDNDMDHGNTSNNYTFDAMLVAPDLLRGELDHDATLNNAHMLMPTHFQSTFSPRNHDNNDQTRVLRRTRAFDCAYPYCGRRFARKQDLFRHERSVHHKDDTFACQIIQCPRFVRGFPRKDKRDEHERKVHGPDRLGF